MNNIVIIGNGAAANSAAETIRQHDARTPVTMIAREEMPLYSPCALPDCLAGRLDRSQLFIKKSADYSVMGIQVHWGQSLQKIDPRRKVVMTEYEEINYDNLVLATGSRAVIPPVIGADLKGNFVVKTIIDIDDIIAHRPQDVLIVGSGNIGVEVAEALQLRGCNVTLVEVRERILPRIFDGEPAQRIEAILLARGIRVYKGEKILTIEGNGRVEKAITEFRSIECDTVIWAAGVKQNTGIAAEAGIKIGKLGGIKVDSGMRTNIDNVFACGDCVESMDRLTGQTGLSLLWSAAKNQGRVAGANCLGLNLTYPGALSLVVEDVYGTTAVSMGLTSEELAGQASEAIEGEEGNMYWRVLLQDERVMGWQSLGITDGLGAIMGLINNRMSVKEARQLISDPTLIRRAAWYLPACCLLDKL